MDCQQKAGYTISVDFFVRFNKQKVLIDALSRYGCLSLLDLSDLLDVSSVELKKIVEDELYFDRATTKTLVELFCVCCGG